MRYVLLTYNRPGGREIWEAMSESARRAEEDEYVDLVKAMRDSNVYVDASEFDPASGPRTVRVRDGDSSMPPANGPTRTVLPWTGVARQAAAAKTATSADTLEV